MDRVLVARRRYADMRRRLDRHCETDRELHDELTRTILSLDRKLDACGEDAPSRDRTPDVLPGDESPRSDVSVRVGGNRR